MQLKHIIIKIAEDYLISGNLYNSLTQEQRGKTMLCLFPWTNIYGSNLAQKNSLTIKIE